MVEAKINGDCPVSRVSLPARAVWWNHGAQIAEGEKYALVEDSEGRWDPAGTKCSYRFSCIINPVELCDDGEWKVTVDNSHGQAASECTLTLRGGMMMMMMSKMAKYNTFLLSCSHPC